MSYSNIKRQVNIKISLLPNRKQSSLVNAKFHDTYVYVYCGKILQLKSKILDYNFYCQIFNRLIKYSTIIIVKISEKICF